MPQHLNMLMLAFGSKQSIVSGELCLTSCCKMQKMVQKLQDYSNLMQQMLCYTAPFRNPLLKLLGKGKHKNTGNCILRKLFVYVYIQNILMFLNHNRWSGREKLNQTKPSTGQHWKCRRTVQNPALGCFISPAAVLLLDIWPLQPAPAVCPLVCTPKNFICFLLSSIFLKRKFTMKCTCE